MPPISTSSRTAGGGTIIGKKSSLPLKQEQEVGDNNGGGVPVEVRAAELAAAAAVAETATATTTTVPKANMTTIIKKDGTTTTTTVMTSHRPGGDRRGGPRKRPNDFIRDQYELIEVNSSSGQCTFLCKHCKSQTFLWQRWNATKATQHVVACDDADPAVKQQAEQSTQKAKKLRRSGQVGQGQAATTTSTVNNDGGASASCNTTEPRHGAIKEEDHDGNRDQNCDFSPDHHHHHHHDPSYQDEMAVEATSSSKSSTTPPPRSQASVTNEALAKSIIRANLEASLARFEPVDRLLDPHVQRAMFTGVLPPEIGGGSGGGNTTSSGGGGTNAIMHPQQQTSPKQMQMLGQIPSSAEELFDTYVRAIDEEVSDELCNLLQRLPGNVTLSVNAVKTCHSKSNFLLFAISKGSVSLFVKSMQVDSLLQLGGGGGGSGSGGTSTAAANAAQEESEVEEAVQTIQDLSAKYNDGKPMTNIDVDPAAENVEKYSADNPQAPLVHAPRRPSQCMDMLSEVSISTRCMQEVTDSALAVAKFVNLPKVREILKELTQNKQLAPPEPACNVAERPMNESIYELLQSVEAHKEFLRVLRHHDAFTEYYDHHCPDGSAEKDLMYNVLNDLTPLFFKKLSIAAQWFRVIHHARVVSSGPAFPMSAYLPLVQAMKNELYDVFRDDPNFDVTMGEGAGDALAEVLRTRFNMDGSPPADGCVGLLVKLQVWAYMVDPNKNLLTPGIALEGGLARHLSEMLQFFVPEYPDPQSSVIAKRRQLRQVFTEIHNQQGDWVYCFDSPPPPPLTAEEALAAQEGLTISQVGEWIDQTGGQSSPLLFFAQMPRIEYYTLIAEPLLSMRTHGSLLRPVHNKNSSSSCAVSVPLENKAEIIRRNAHHRHNNHTNNDEQALDEQEKAETLLRAGLNVRFLFDATRGVLVKKTAATVNSSSSSNSNSANATSNHHRISAVHAV